jgi:hypothetical protein
MQSIPIEVQSLILQHLYTSSLHSAYQVCTSWNRTIQEDAFCQSYAQSCTTKDMKALTPEFLNKLLLHFSPSQLYCMDGKKITRHLLNAIAETDSNQLNLRIIKLLSSLDWYQRIIQKNKDWCIQQWHANDPLGAKQFEESLEYIHLFILGSYRGFDEYEKVKFIDLAPHEKEQKLNIDLIELNPGKAMEKIDEICQFDYVALKNTNTLILNDLFREVFSRHRITYLVTPATATIDNSFYLPTVLLKNLFLSLTSQYMATNKPCENEIDFLKILELNNIKLECLGKWLETTQIPINKLVLHIAYENTITVEDMKTFGESLLKSNVKNINFSFDPYVVNRNLKDIFFQIMNSLNRNESNRGFRMT